MQFLRRSWCFMSMSQVLCGVKKSKKLEVLMIISGMLHMFFVHSRSLRSLLRWMDGEIDK